MKVKIGNVEIKNNVFLAPMAGITDIAFRTICALYGCGITYSEMVSAKGIMHNSKNTKKLLEIDEKEDKIAVQLFGSDPDILADMAKRLEDNPKIAFFDINMGCPAPKIFKNGDGSALMQNPELIGKIVKTVSQNIKKPLTIKIRKGINNNNINALEIAKIAEENGAKGIAIHGRTREQFYSGNADWSIIKKIKENTSLTVIGNGDIDTPQKAKEILEYTKCDAIMIGRASQGNPFIFKNVIHYLKTGEILEEPSLEEKLQVALQHLALLAKYKGEYIATREMRKHLCWYIKGIPKCSSIRQAINKIEDYKELENFIKEMKTTLP